MAPPNPTPQGLSSEIISRIHHLQQLLDNLPADLPFTPEISTYHFGLDTELVDEEGVWFAFNCNLEVCFEMHKIPLSRGTVVFHERGDQFDALIKMIKAM